MLVVDGAYEPFVHGSDVSRGVHGRQAMRALKESLLGLRPRAHTDPPRIETGKEE